MLDLGIRMGLPLAEMVGWQMFTMVTTRHGVIVLLLKSSVDRVDIWGVAGILSFHGSTFRQPWPERAEWPVSAFSIFQLNQHQPARATSFRCGPRFSPVGLVWGLGAGNLAQCSLRLVRKYGIWYTVYRNLWQCWWEKWRKMVINRLILESLFLEKSVTGGVDGPCMQMPNYGCHREAQRLVHFNSLSWWFSSQSISQFQFHFS